MPDDLEEKPHYVGIAKGVDAWDGWYVIAAEYKDHYQVFGGYERLEDAKRILPRIRRELREKQ